MIPYVTTRQIKVDLWQAGLLYHLLQVGILVFYGQSIVLQGDWLLSVPINGHSVPYAVAAQQLPSGSQPYCSNPSYNYTYSSSFIYVAPECDVSRVEVSVNKRKNYLSFSTVFIEWQDFSWACSDTSGEVYQTATAACTAAGSAVITNGAQCSCSTSRSVFPLEIEENSYASRLCPHALKHNPTPVRPCWNSQLSECVSSGHVHRRVQD